ncbi:MAG: hypothetical protein WBF73_36260, partial [Bradyrhizobium sp.]
EGVTTIRDELIEVKHWLLPDFVEIFPEPLLATRAPLRLNANHIGDANAVGAMECDLNDRSHSHIRPRCSRLADPIGRPLRCSVGPISAVPIA